MVFLLIAASVAAQTKPKLFTEISTRNLDLSADQSNVLEALKAQPTSSSVRVVQLTPSLLSRSTGLVLNILPGVELDITEVKTETRSPGSYSWHGSNPDTGSDAVLVVEQNTVVGTIRSGQSLYFVRPLGNGLHAIVDVDEKAFPKDEHPPEQRELERQQPRNLDLRAFAVERDELQDEGTVITAIVAYTPAVRTALGSAAAAQGLVQVAVDETNQSYANSGIALRLHLVHTYETAYVESGNMVTDRDRFRTPGDGFMDEIHGLRNQHNADVALVITQGGGFCGIAAAILADETTAFAVVEHTCATGYYSFGHEIGHLFGARHNPEADNTTTPFAYGHGFFNAPNHWRTVMSYDCPGGCTRQPYWSDPLVNFSGQPTGTAATHNNARVLTETAPLLANFRRSTASADRVGYAWANSPAAASYTPSVPYSYNSAGEPITITRSAAGTYAVTFAGLGGSGSFGGNVQVTAYGSGSESCKVASWSSGAASFVVNVRCFTAAGAAADTQYTVLVNWPK